MADNKTFGPPTQWLLNPDNINPLTLSDGRSVEVQFISRKDIDPQSEINQLRENTLELLAHGYEYLISVLGPGYEQLPVKIGVILSMETNHRFQGALMKASIPRLRQYQDTLDSGERYAQARERSLVVHDLTHSLTDIETMPMFIEMIYMLEQGFPERVEEIQRMYQAEELSPKHARGIEELTSFLGLANPSEMFTQLSSPNLDQLKQKFREGVLQL